jgi:hypothetical protein
MKAIFLIPAVALLVSACASGPSGAYYGSGGPGYYGGGTVYVNDRDHRYDNSYNVADVNVNRTNINDRTVNRTTVNDSRVTNKKSTIAIAGKHTVKRKSNRDSSSLEQQVH